MHRHRLIAALAAALTASLAGTAGADILFNQIPTDQITGIASATVPNQPITRAADDFTITGPAGSTVRLTRFVGHMMTSIGADPSRYRLEIYDDNAGKPGSVIWSRDGASYMNDGGWYPGQNMRIQELVYNDNDLLLQANTRYWISFVGLGGVAAFASHSWGGTLHGLNAQARVGTSDWFDSSLLAGDYRDLAFRIDGTIIPPVPAPGAALVLAAGGGILARRRRR